MKSDDDTDSEEEGEDDEEESGKDAMEQEVAKTVGKPAQLGGFSLDRTVYELFSTSEVLSIS